jgi:tRNA acetyltransferase TAN1
MLEEVRTLHYSPVSTELTTYQCAERFYGIVSTSGEQEDEVDDSVDDIETSIQKEMASMSKKQGNAKLFSPVRLDLQCVLFFKTRPPIDPVDFVHKICKEIVSTPGIRRMRYINRLTPMTLMGKATEKGLEEVARAVLGSHFNLREDQEQAISNEGKEEEKKPSETISDHSVSLRLFRLRCLPLHASNTPLN